MPVPVGPSDGFNHGHPHKHKDPPQQTFGDAQQEHLDLVHNQGTNIGVSGSGPSNPVAPSQNFGSTHAYVIQKQRFLRALGFNVVVDGVWGPQSQAAWNAYLRQRGVSSGATIDVNHDASLLRQLNRRKAAVQARAAAQMAQAQARLLAAQRNIQHIKDEQAQRSLVPTHSGPTFLPSGGTLEQLKRQEKEEQEYLQRNYGFPGAQQAGEIWRLSNLLGDPRTRRRTLRGMSAANLRTILFDPQFGTFGTDDRSSVRILQGYLAEHGHKDIREDGVFDQKTLDGLTSEMQALARQEYHDKVVQIRDLFFDPTQPIDLSGLPGFKKHDPKNARDLLARIQVGDVVARRLAAEVFRRLSVHQLGQIRAKYLHAGVQAKREAQMGLMLQQQAERDAQRDSFLGMIARPFNWLTNKTRAGFIEIGWAVDDLIHLRVDKWFMTDEELEEQDRKALAKVALFDKDHVYLGIATSLLADPTNLIPGRWILAPFRIAGRGAATSAKFLEEAGFRLSATGRITKLPGLALTLPARTGRVPSNVVRAIERAGTHPELAGVGDMLAYRIVTEVRHATRLLSDTRRAAHIRTVTALRNGFRVTAGLVEKPPKLPTDLADRFDESFLGAVKYVDEPSPEIVNAFVGLRQSVYAGLEDQTLTPVGAMLQGALSASVRQDAVLELAREHANSVVSALKSRSEWAEIAGSPAEGLPTAYDKAVEDFVRRAGPYVMGHGDPEITAVLDPLVQTRLEAINNLFLPALQKRIEMTLDGLGETLWDEQGKFLSKNDVGDIMRRLGSESFSDDALVRVKNPMFGRYWNHKEAVEFAERELRIRSTQKQAWFARQKALGVAVPDEWLSEQIGAIKAELDQAWQLVEHGSQAGKWTDTREVLKVSEFYLRQYRFIRELRPSPVAVPAGGGFGDYEPVDPFRFSDLARSPRRRNLNADDADLGFFPLQMEVDRIASYFRFARPDDSELLALEIPEPSFRGEMLPYEREQERMQQFQDAFAAFESDYKEAYDASFAQSMAREGALYSALRYSQHAKTRFLFNRMEGWLGTWRFMALPLRSGWTVVNYIDNTVKAMLEGTISPKHWFRALEGGGQHFVDAAEAAHTVFEAGWSEIRHITRFFDTIFGTDMTSAMDEVFDRFWRMPAEIQKRVFHLHGFEFPDEMLAAAQQQNEIQKGLRTAEQIAEGAQKVTVLPTRLEAPLASFRDRVWDMFGNRPENFAKRAIYNKTLEKATKEGKGLLEAHKEAWAAVDRTLFDYSKISTFEDNIRFLFPFVQWVRKNNQFWLRQAARRPALTFGVIDSYGEFKAQINKDMPQWAQRYAPLKWASDVVGRIPALRWMAGPLADSVTDPINLLSVKNLYHYFTQENPNMPADQAGFKFTDGFVSALEDFGLSMNPLVRKPLEMAGVVDLRTWQAVFPQTSLVEAFTRKFWKERWPNGFNLERMLEDPILKLMGKETSANVAAANFDTYVRMEMANQAARGEQLNKVKAEEKIRDWLLVQAAVGFFTGIYVRRLTPEDIYYSQIADELSKHGLAAWNDMTPQEKTNYRLWQKRKDQVQFDHYVEQLPLIRAFYAIPDYVGAQEFLKQHPNILPFVDESWRTYANGGGNPGYVVRHMLHEQTDLARSLWDLEDKLELDPSVTKLAEQLLVTPELRRFWKLNDTAADVQEKMLRAQYFRHIKSLNDTYHSIPSTDFDARRGFLAEHPELERSWNLNNKDSDDFKVIINGVQADLRDRYFEFVDAGDWNTAAAFLAAFPMTFDHFDEKGNFVRDRLTGRSHNQHVEVFGKAREALARYFSMSPTAQSRWLAEGSHDANLAAQYLDTFGGFRGGAQGGMTQHARDYLAAKKWLDYYFSLTGAKRSAWLDGGSAGAATVLSYFKKYGTTHHFERGFSGAGAALLAAENAELRSRLAFWQRYFALPPSKRPMFVMNHAEDAGIFVYGMFGAKELHDREMAFMRKAMAAGMSARAAAYLFVKPLLDIYFTLNKDQRRLFMRANPEVAWYFENYADTESLSGDPKVDKLIEQYFRLPDDSDLRSVFLRKHPEVQAYFDAHSTPAQRAMRNILNVYFDITDPAKRKEFLRKHPEIQAYFDKRQRERDLEKIQLEAFDNADPRLRDFFAQGAASILPAAQHMRSRLAFGSDRGLTLTTRGVVPSDS